MSAFTFLSDFSANKVVKKKKEAFFGTANKHKERLIAWLASSLYPAGT